MAIQLRPEERDIGTIVNALIQVVQGRGNNIGRVTLTPAAVLTVVEFPNCSKECVVLLFPRTANAAAAVPTTYIPDATVLQGGFTIRHANNAQTDRDFFFLCIGG